MWNDTDIPLAHLITFRSYGTWLHGDKRGSVDRFHNQYQAPYLPPNPKQLEHKKSLLAREITTLNAKQRKSVENAIRETCDVRRWILRAINIRTNHVHTVVSIGTAKPERALNAFKAYPTRKCVKTAVGTQQIALGRTRGASETCGLNEVWKRQSNMFFTGRVMTCLTSTDRRKSPIRFDVRRRPPAYAGGSDRTKATRLRRWC